MGSLLQGISCLFSPETMPYFLSYFANKNFQFFVPWCSFMRDNTQKLPETTRNMQISATELEQLAAHNIWELVLHVYPSGTEIDTIYSYSDYLNSHCSCCVIFYDCGMTEIYVKERTMFQDIDVLVKSLNASLIAYITEDTNNRIIMLP